MEECPPTHTQLIHPSHRMHAAGLHAGCVGCSGSLLCACSISALSLRAQALLCERNQRALKLHWDTRVACGSYRACAFAIACVCYAHTHSHTRHLWCCAAQGSPPSTSLVRWRSWCLAAYCEFRSETTFQHSTRACVMYTHSQQRTR